MVPRLVVFDLDGTLIDSQIDLSNSINAMLAHLGKPALPHAVIAGYIGSGTAFAEGIAEFGIVYAEQTEKDWEELRRSGRAGKRT